MNPLDINKADIRLEFRLPGSTEFHVIPMRLDEYISACIKPLPPNRELEAMFKEDAKKAREMMANRELVIGEISRYLARAFVAEIQKTDTVNGYPK